MNTLSPTTKTSNHGCPECADRGYIPDPFTNGSSLVMCPLCGGANHDIDFRLSDAELAQIMQDYEARGVDLAERDEELEALEYDAA